MRSYQGRAVISICQTLGFRNIVTADISRAFLSAEPYAPGEEVFLDFPREVKSGPKSVESGFVPGSCLRANVSIYGLKEAANRWFVTLAAKMRSLGWEASVACPCVFRHSDASGKTDGVVGIHVDDLMIGGTAQVKDELIKGLRTSFELGELEYVETGTTFCGRRVREDDEDVYVDVEDKARRLDRYTVDDGREDELLSDEEVRRFRSSKGGALYVVGTRPDYAFEMHAVSRGNDYEKKNGVDGKAMNKLIDGLAGDCERGLRFPPIKEKMKLVCFCDASKDTAGLLILAVPVSWKPGNARECRVLEFGSFTLPRKATGSYGPELQAANITTDRGLMLASELGRFLGYTPAVELLTDSYSLITRLEGTCGISLTEAAVYGDLSPLKQKFEGGCFKVRFVNDRGNPADCLTKPISRKSEKFRMFHDIMNGTLTISEEDANGRRKS